MKFLPHWRVWLLRGAGGLASAAIALYLLRWSIFEDLVRREIARQCVERLGADPEVRRLGGSLITSLTAEDVVLRPRPGASFRSAGARRIDVHYGLFGWGRPVIAIDGARLELAGSRSAAPQAAPIAAALGRFDVPASIRLSRSEVILPDGRSVRLEAACIDGAALDIRGNAPEVGDFAVYARRGPDGRMAVEAHLGKEILTWEGRLTPGRIEGMLSHEHGRARTVFDLETGRGEIAGSADFPDFSVHAGVKGPLDGPLRAWEVSGLELLAKPMRVLGLSLPSFTLTSPGGPLGDLAWRAEARPGPSIRGVLRWRDRLEVEADVEAGDAFRGVHVRVAQGERGSVEASVTAEEIAPPAPLGAVRNLRLEGRWAGGSIDLVRGEGVMGQGPFQLHGSWRLGSEGRPLALSLRGQELLVVDDELTRVRANPSVTLTSKDGAGWRLEGEVVLPLFLCFREFPQGRLVRPPDSRKIDAPGLHLDAAPEGGFLILPGRPGLEDVALDLRLAAPGEVRVENSAVGVLLRADGRIRGTAAAPAFSGKVWARRGEIKLATGLFVRIHSASALLPDEPGREPTVHFEGSAGRGDGAISIIADGRLADPDLALSSTPPRSEREILSYLAFGRWPGPASGESAVGTLASRVFGDTLSARPRADRDEGLLERLQPTIVPDADEATRKPGERPPAGTGRGFLVRTEYSLNRYLSIVVETDREGDVGGDLKIRLRF